jgi:hypothetical protein
MPFQKFPGIAMIIDSYTKKIIHSYFDQRSEAPRYLSHWSKIIRMVPVPHHTKFYYDDPNTGIRLSGTPDDIYLLEDSSFVVVDYKTARLNENQYYILPLYETQLNAYAVIAEENGYNPVSKLDLVYFEPQTLLDRDIDSAQMDKGFRLSFNAKMDSVELCPQQIPFLLKQAKELIDMPKPPPSREGCKDCQLLSKIVETYRIF